MTNTNRNKGHDAEREFAKVFREDLGFSYCKTARYGSRLHDDAGIDLINIPVNVQIKAGIQKGLNPSSVLRTMKERIGESFPPDAKEHENVSVVLHRKQVKKGKKRDEFDNIVSLSFEDFQKLLKQIHNK